MKSLDLVENCPGLTYRKLDHWCRNGVFGDTYAQLPEHVRRDFTDEDARVAKVLGRVSLAFESWSHRGGLLPLYREIAVQVRDDVSVAVVRIGPGITFIVDLEKVHSD